MKDQEPWPWAGMKETATRLGMWTTDPWAAERILDVELLTRRVIDPCCGTGIMAEAAKRHGYDVWASDVFDWGYGRTGVDFLAPDPLIEEVARDQTIFMNPPFDRAVAFIERAIALRPRKIVCFEKFSFWESTRRAPLWANHPPARVYVCRQRATCWRIDISPEERGERGNTPTAHAWFVWERGHPPGPVLGHLDRAELSEEAHV